MKLPYLTSTLYYPYTVVFHNGRTVGFRTFHSLMNPVNWLMVVLGRRRI